MSKSVFTAQYAAFLRELRRARKRTGTTQAAIAQRLDMTQSMVSKCERGERRIDVIELWGWCQAMKVSFTEFVQRLESVIK